MGLVLHKSSLGQGLGNKGTVCPSGWVALRGWGGGGYYRHWFVKGQPCPPCVGIALAHWLRPEPAEARVLPSDLSDHALQGPTEQAGLGPGSAHHGICPPGPQTRGGLTSARSGPIHLSLSLFVSPPPFPCYHLHLFFLPRSIPPIHRLCIPRGPLPLS